MSVGQQIMVAAFLGSYVAVWWLAVRVLFGRRLGYFEWVPVAIAAFAIPMLLADWNAGSRFGWSDGWVLWFWFSIAAIIDIAWAVNRVFNRLRRESCKAGPR